MYKYISNNLPFKMVQKIKIKNHLKIQKYLFYRFIYLYFIIWRKKTIF